eukprot:768797-Hanusia_phi.AAC.7
MASVLQGQDDEGEGGLPGSIHGKRAEALHGPMVSACWCGSTAGVEAAAAVADAWKQARHEGVGCKALGQAPCSPTCWLARVHRPQANQLTVWSQLN